MKDPYEILGVNRNATEEEIKAAYKELARKYHPDNYADNPLSDLAEEKMKETNEAYDRIIAKKRNKGKSSGNYGSNGGSSDFADIRNMINANKLEEAQELIDGIDISRRNAEWYFLSGSVLYKRGWYDDAYSSFAAACRMDPSNMEFRAAFNRMNAQRSGKFYNGGYRTPNYNSGGCSTCDICSGLICADCCCECMGGDLISCC